MNFSYPSDIRGALILSVLMLTACGGSSGGGGSTTDTTAPTVASTSPAKDATGVAVNAAVTVTFSESIDCTSLTAAFTINGVTGAVTCNGNTATLTPANSLNSNTSYTATISTGARDSVGNALAANQVWKFTTAPARIVFAENSNIYSVKEDGSGLLAMADTLNDEQIVYWCSGSYYDYFNSCYASNSQPMVQNGRAVYQSHNGSNPADIYAVNLDGTQRTTLAATVDDEQAAILLGDRLIYTSKNTATNTTNVRSIRLDGSGDVALTQEAASVRAIPIGVRGMRLIFSDPAGTYISDADGSNRVTLWNKGANWVVVSDTRLLLADLGELVSVNPDGSGFVSLSTTFTIGGGGNGYARGLTFGLAGGRVFYRSYIPAQGNSETYQLKSVDLNGNNPLVLFSSTTVNFQLFAVSGTRLIADEFSGVAGNVVSYDVTQADSRSLVLANHSFYSLIGNRVVGVGNGTALGTAAISAVNIDGSAAVPLTPDILPIDGSHLVYLNNNQIVYKRSAASGQIEAYAVGLDGNGVKQITSGSGDKEPVALSGDRLVYQSHIAGDIAAQRDLHSVLLDGTDTLDYATTAEDESYMGQFGTNLIYSSTNGDTAAMKLVPDAGGTAVPLQSSASTKSLVGAF